MPCLALYERSWCPVVYCTNPCTNGDAHDTAERRVQVGEELGILIVGLEGVIEREFVQVPVVAWQVLGHPAQMAIHRRRVLGEQLAVDRDVPPSAARTSSCALRMTVSASHQN